MKYLFMLLVGAVLLGGCASTGTSKPTDEAGVGTNAPKESGEQQPFNGSFKSALALGFPMKCTYDLGEGQQGTGYLKGNKYRGEATVEGKKVSVIVKDQCVWSWGEDSTQGVTFCAKEEDQSIWDDEQTSVPDSDISCLPAVIDDSQFEVDSTVNFIDLSQFQGMMPPTQ